MHVGICFRFNNANAVCHFIPSVIHDLFVGIITKEIYLGRFSEREDRDGIYISLISKSYSGLDQKLPTLTLNNSDDVGTRV